ncbi:MAG: dihydropteroate synthase [Alphaproteobacteria bacterium]
MRDGARVERQLAAPDEIEAWSASQPDAVAARLRALRRNLDAKPTPAWAKGRGLPLVMGIVNVTPDSFSDGGDHPTPEAAIERGLGLIAEGADIVDVGGESTRPGSSAPLLDEELARAIPVVEALAGRGAVVSIDTRRAAVMQAALAAGAGMLNDVSALRHDPACLGVVAAHDVPVVLMHMQGTPETMQAEPRYDCAPLDVFDFLEARIAACEAAGVPRRRLVVDPGIGFGKTVEHNLEIIRDLAVLRGLGCPVMVGLSRKGFIGRLTGIEKPKDRLAGSLAGALHAVASGASILRVHDVAATRHALALWQAIEAAP